MSGHSKWSTIKHQKGAADAKRGVLFTKLSRDIALAVRGGGGVDPDMNFKAAIGSRPGQEQQYAAGQHQPRPQAGQRRRQRRRIAGAGDLRRLWPRRGRYPVAGGDHQSQPHRRRSTLGLNRGGGNLGESGCVAWNFELRGVVTIDIDDEERAEELGLLAIDAGAEDIEVDEGVLEVYSPIESLQDVQKTIQAEGVAVRSAEMSMVPKATIALGDREAEQTPAPAGHAGGLGRRPESLHQRRLPARSAGTLPGRVAGACLLRQCRRVAGQEDISAYVYGKSHNFPGAILGDYH